MPRQFCNRAYCVAEKIFATQITAVCDICPDIRKISFSVRHPRFPDLGNDARRRMTGNFGRLDARGGEVLVAMPAGLHVRGYKDPYRRRYGDYPRWRHNRYVVNSQRRRGVIWRGGSRERHARESAATGILFYRVVRKQSHAGKIPTPSPHAPVRVAHVSYVISARSEINLAGDSARVF